ncbi:MAG: hypothetical protein IJO43_00150 [Bacilli bacterium]|nr:hypothetical protein [Bacilli bacterium]
MNIELDELFCHNTDKIIIDSEINFTSEYSSNDIKSLENVHFNGNIKESSDTTIKLEGILNGTMVIEDSISLEDVKYDFSCEIDENLDEILENNQNTIDILEILWQNIVLEIPLKYTVVEDLSKYQGDGWKVISEDDVKRDNPFSILAENMKEE